MDDAPRNPGTVIPPRLRILASGSAGNCAVLVHQTHGGRRACLIDAGLSPRRTRRLLAEDGLGLADLDCILLTHLDGDHWHRGWVRALPPRVRLHIHRRHRWHPAFAGTTLDIGTFSGAFEPAPGVAVRTVLNIHDDDRSVAFRFDFPCGASLGYATDLGRVSQPLVRALRYVDLLAIESNYCPRMQTSSLRPEYLKDRIMGGRGHLSNQQAAAAICEIQPAQVVFLHLSRECNQPDRVAGLHQGGGYPFTIADQRTPTPWLEIRPAARPGLCPRPQFGLFSAHALAVPTPPVR